MQTTSKRSQGFDLTGFLRENWFFLLIFALLVILPHLIGWLSGDSPFGRPRGDRFIMSGQSTFWQSVLIEMFALSILVMSYNLMFGFTGVISFGHAMFFGLGGYLTGLLLEFGGMDPTLALILGFVATLGVTALIGLGIGLATLRLRGIYFAIFTLAVAEIVWLFFLRWSVTNGEDGLTIANMPEWIDPTRYRINLYYVSLILFVLCFIFIRRMVNSPTGAVFKAIRENEERAQALGYNTLRFKLIAITAASMMAGIAGIIHAVLAKSARPEFLGVSHTVDSLLMTIIGGVGTFTGPIIGAAGLELADVLFRDLELTVGTAVINIGDSWNFLLGLIFVLVVLVFPLGVVGTIQRWRMRRAANRRTATQSTGEAQRAAGD